MIHVIDDSVFESNCDILVNTINCRGVMRAGIALEFALRYPRMYKEYVQDCNESKISTGKTYLYECDGQKILNFPTKDDYKEPSRIEYLVEGLKFFVEHYKEYGANSIAFPLLGCTNGGLDFEKDVKPIMLGYLSDIDMDVYICTNSLCSGLELLMLNYIKSFPISKMMLDLNITDFAPEDLGMNVQLSNRFWQLASKKAVGSIDNYIKIWNYIRSKIDQ